MRFLVLVFSLAIANAKVDGSSVEFDGEARGLFDSNRVNQISAGGWRPPVAYILPRSVYDLNRNQLLGNVGQNAHGYHQAQNLQIARGIAVTNDAPTEEVSARGLFDSNNVNQVSNNDMFAIPAFFRSGRSVYDMNRNQMLGNVAQNAVGAHQKQNLQIARAVAVTEDDSPTGEVSARGLFDNSNVNQLSNNNVFALPSFFGSARSVLPSPYTNLNSNQMYSNVAQNAVGAHQKQNLQIARAVTVAEDDAPTEEVSARGLFDSNNVNQVSANNKIFALPAFFSSGRSVFPSAYNMNSNYLSGNVGQNALGSHQKQNLQIQRGPY